MKIVDKKGNEQNIKKMRELTPFEKRVLDILYEDYYEGYNDIDIVERDYQIMILLIVMTLLVQMKKEEKIILEINRFFLLNLNLIFVSLVFPVLQ